MWILFVTVAVALGTKISADVVCSPSENGSHWKEDPDDCAKFYLCFNGRKYNFSCSDSVWDPATKACVAIGSRWDKCSIRHELESLSPCSRREVEIAPKGDNCAQYYDCRSSVATLSKDRYLKECPYPMLFNKDTNRCEHYSLVTCGDRKEARDPCDYEANQCGHVQCVPCHVRFPSCSGQKDGLNPWIGREWSPFFVVCEEGRVIYQGQCDLTHAVVLFNPEKRTCEEVTDERVERRNRM